MLKKFIIYQNLIKYFNTWIDKKNKVKYINWKIWWEEISLYKNIKKVLDDYNDIINIDIKKRI